MIVRPGVCRPRDPLDEGEVWDLNTTLLLSVARIGLSIRTLESYLSISPFFQFSTVIIDITGGCIISVLFNYFLLISVSYAEVDRS